MLAILEWALSNDTGLSSRALVKFLLGMTDNRYYYPIDGQDMGRCIRAIRKMPSLRDQLPSAAKMGKQWAIIVKNWDDIETAYQHGQNSPEEYRHYDRYFRALLDEGIDNNDD